MVYGFQYFFIPLFSSFYPVFRRLHSDQLHLMFLANAMQGIYIAGKFFMNSNYALTSPWLNITGNYTHAIRNRRNQCNPAGLCIYQFLKKRTYFLPVIKKISW